MFQILGNLSNKIADVTVAHALRVLAQSLGPQFDATYRLGLAWTVETTQTPTGAGDYFLYIRNDSDVRDLIITAASFDMGTADVIEIRSVTGTPASGTAITPINRQLGSTNNLNATIEGGSDITGLTGGGSFDRIKVGTTVAERLNLLERPIVLPRSRPDIAIGFAAITGTVAINAQVDIMIQTVDPREVN